MKRALSALLPVFFSGVALAQSSRYPPSGSNGTLTSLTVLPPLTGGTITTSGSIGIPAATNSANGYLTSADWTTFNAKQNSVSVTPPLTFVANDLAMPAATNSANGYLTSADWTTFNAKQPVISATAGSVFFSGGGSTVSEDNANLFWDVTNHFLGVGTTLPQGAIDATGNVFVHGVNAAVSIGNGGGGSGFPALKFAGSAVLQRDNEDSSVLDVGGGFGLTRFMTTGNAETMRLTPGSVGIGTVSPSGRLQLHDGHFLVTQTTAPAGAALTAAGSGATCTVTGSDTAGAITLVMGTGLNSGDMCTVTFNLAYGAAPVCTATPASRLTASNSGGSQYLTASTTVLTLGYNSNFANSGNTNVWNYHCVGD